MQIHIKGSGDGTVHIDLSLCNFEPRSIPALCKFARDKVVDINIVDGGIKFVFREPHIVHVDFGGDDLDMGVRSAMHVDQTPFVAMAKAAVYSALADIALDIASCKEAYDG